MVGSRGFEPPPKWRCHPHILFFSYVLLPESYLPVCFINRGLPVFDKVLFANSTNFGEESTKPEQKGIKIDNKFGWGVGYFCFSVTYYLHKL